MALGYSTDIQILDLLGEEEKLKATLDKDTTKSEEEALIEIYKRLRLGSCLLSRVLKAFCMHYFLMQKV